MIINSLTTQNSGFYVEE